MFKGLKIKDIIKYLLIALIINVLFCIPLYSSDLYRGADIMFHMSRIDGILTSIKDYQFPLKIYPYKNYGYGYASPLFYCDIFFLIPAFLYLIGFSLVNSYKIFVFLIGFVGTFIMLIATKYITKNKKYLYIIITIIFSFSSYRYNDFFIRAAIGECLAFTFMPLLFISLYRLIVEHRKNWFEIGITFVGLLLSHMITFAISCVIFGVICLVNIKTLIKHKQIKTILWAIVFAILITAFYLLPCIEQLLSQKFLMQENGLIYGEWKMIDASNTFAESLSDYVFMKGDPQNYRHFMGISVVVSFITCIIIQIKQNKDCLFNWTMLGLAFILYLMTINVIPISKISFMQTIQFPYRLLTEVTTFVMLMLGKLLDKEENTFVLIYAICMMAYASINIEFIDHQLLTSLDTIKNNASYEDLYLEGEYDTNWYYYNELELAEGEYLPFTYNQRYDQKDDGMSSCIIFPNGGVYTCDFKRHGTTIDFTSYYEWEENMLMPLSWYKGYAVKELDNNGNVISITSCTANEINKRVEFKVGAGEHHYKVYYKGTKIQTVSAIVSILSTIGYTCYFVIKRKREKRTNYEKEINCVV